MSFLSKKPWHPSTMRNQEMYWKAEQATKERKRHEEEARREVQKDLDEQHYRRLAAEAAKRHGSVPGNPFGLGAADSAAVGFLYAKPPGLVEGGGSTGGDAGDEDDGEDAAVREFKRKLAIKRNPDFGASATQWKLEEMVGRKRRDGLTVEEQVERFPILKDAPVFDKFARNLKLNFKPVGVELRHVQCLRCGTWGHRSGDRECEMRDFNPQDAERRLREDPLTAVRAQLGNGGAAAVGAAAAAGAAIGGEASSGTAAGGIGPDAGGADGAAGTNEAEAELLASLTDKQKRRLLKRLQAMDSDGDISGSGSDNDRHEKKERKRKHKHKHKHKRSRKRKHSDSSSEDDSEDGSRKDSGRKERKRERHVDSKRKHKHDR